MAELKIGFVTFNPGSGDGDQAVTVTGEKYEGREQRTVTTSFETEEGSVKKQVVVNQAAIAEFVKIDPTASVGKEGGNITINGTSNSTKLTFSLQPDGEHPLTIELPANYTAAGKQTANGVAIADDPGATGGFSFSITISGIGANHEVTNLVNTLTVTAEGGQSANTVITQTPGDPMLDVDTEVINLDANGSAQTVNVTANTKWRIVQAVTRMMKNLKK